VVSNLTAMNMWDGVCMFFIYASFIEFILVNYLARWVQDPEQQKKKRENAILDVRLTNTSVCCHNIEMSRKTAKQTNYLDKTFELCQTLSPRQNKISLTFATNLINLKNWEN
jgi:hypothetical protein